MRLRLPFRICHGFHRRGFKTAFSACKSAPVGATKGREKEAWSARTVTNENELLRDVLFCVLPCCGPKMPVACTWWESQTLAGRLDEWMDGWMDGCVNGRLADGSSS